MSLFNKLNQIKDLRQQAKTMQSALAEEQVTIEKRGLILTMDGNQKIVKLELPNDYLTPDKKSALENLLIDAHADAITKVQRLMAEKVKAMGNFNLPGLS